MPLTKDFRETVQARARRDPAFRAALLEEAIQAMLEDDMETGKLVLRNYINATNGFSSFAKEMRKSSKSLMRMLSPQGNPAAENVFRILDLAQRNEGICFSIRRVKHSAQPSQPQSNGVARSARSSSRRSSA